MGSKDSTVAPIPGLGQPGRPLRALVDLGRLAANAARMRKAAKGLGLLAVVKADGYGHGAVLVSRALEAAGAEGRCVATLAEALDLRQAGISLPIQVFGGLGAGDLPLASAQAIDFTVVSAAHLAELAPELPRHPVGLHLELDTGMGRSGLLLPELGGSLDALRKVQPWIKGIMTHLACADEPDPAFSLRQRRAFDQGLVALGDGGIRAPWIHAANSAGCVRGFTGGDTHVRCGIALYGLLDLDEAAGIGLEPILELLAEVTRVVQAPAGTTVGYGRTYVAPRPQVLATLNCGYADGYPRALANRSWAGFRGNTYPVVGRVSMDSITVALPEGTAVAPGETMTVLSRETADPHSVIQTARLLGTIPYEVTCGLNRRVLRQPA